MNMPNECFERVQMKDGSFALCKVSYVITNGELRITGIVEEVGVRRDAAGRELTESLAVEKFMAGLPMSQGLNVRLGTKAAQMATRLAAERDPLVTVSFSPRSGRIVIKRTRKGGAK